MNPWTNPSSYEPDLDAPNWWERNRVTVMVLAAIALLAVLAFVVPESLKR